DVRLLTLTGTGGTGKTRLALHVAAGLLEDYADGLFFVPLAPISDPGLVASAIAQTLGIKEAPGTPLVDSLKDYLRERQMLLLLDNFERVATAPPLLSEPPSVSPRLKVRVNSPAILR